MMSIKNIVKKGLPGRVIRRLIGLFYGWQGNYDSWEDVKNKCSGYDSQTIIDNVTASALKVKEGLAVYERDSVLFYNEQYTFPVLSALMWIAAKNMGNLNVLDFGGSLGSTYFQNKLFLDSLPEVNWCIVEQPGFVKTGIENFEDQRLHFFYSIEECLNLYGIHVVLLSSVLQYLEDPYKLLDQIKSQNLKYIIIDRTPFINGDERITLQRVNPRIYKGSYPCWFLNEDKFIAALSSHYKLVLEFDALDRANIKSYFKGFVFELFI